MGKRAEQYEEHPEHEEKHPFLASLEQARLQAGARSTQHKDRNERRAIHTSPTGLIAGEIDSIGAAGFSAALRDVKMVLVVRSDLKMSTGKIASQVSHLNTPIPRCCRSGIGGLTTGWFP